MLDAIDARRARARIRKAAQREKRAAGIRLVRGAIPACPGLCVRLVEITDPVALEDWLVSSGRLHDWETDFQVRVDEAIRALIIEAAQNVCPAGHDASERGL